MGHITLLESAGPRLAKRITETGIEPYDSAAYFTPTTRDIASIHELSELLDEIAENRRVCAIRGFPVSREQAERTRFDDGKAALNGARYLRRAELFRDEPTDWVMIDVDGGEMSHPGNVEMSILGWVESHLPVEFHGVTLHYQLSASHGLKPGLRAHLWFMLSRVHTSSVLKTWAKTVEGIDHSLFATVQIHYTANPEVDDPFCLIDVPSVRSGLILGTAADEVDLNLAPQSVVQSSVADDDDNFAALERLASRLDITVEQAQVYLDKIPNAGDAVQPYDVWLEIGMALQHQFADEGLALWRAWSEQSPKYDARDLERRWKSFSAGRGRSLTFATVIKHAGGRVEEKASHEASFLDLQQRIRSCKSIVTLTTDLLREVATSEMNADLRASLVPELKAAAKKNCDTTLSVTQLKATMRQMTRGDVDAIARNLELALARMVAIEHFGGEGAPHLMVVSGTVWQFIAGRWATVLDKGDIASRALDTIERCLAERTPLSEALENNLVSDDERTARLGTLAEAVSKVLLLKSVSQEQDPLGLMAFKSRSVINTRNGELWFDHSDNTVALLPHDPDSRLLSQVNCAYLPQAKAPRFQSVLDRIFAEEDDGEDQQRHYLELMAYTLMENRRYGEVAILWKAEAASGKTLLNNVMTSLMGPSMSRTISFAQMEKRGVDAHWEDSLVGVHWLVDDDFKKGALLGDDVWKKISGEKLMTANPKFRSPFNFVCRAVCGILSNHWPSLREFSEGFRRRAHVFSAGRTIPEDQRDATMLANIIEHELSGVLNLLVEAYLRLMQRGRFQMPAGCRRSLEMWLESGSPVIRFLREAVEVTGSSSDRVNAGELYDLYGDYCRHYEGNTMQLSRHRFYESLTEAGYHVIEARARSKIILGCVLKGEFQRVIEESRSWDFG